MHKNISNIFSENACKVCYELEWTVSTPLWEGDIINLSHSFFTLHNNSNSFEK